VQAFVDQEFWGYIDRTVQKLKRTDFGYALRFEVHASQIPDEKELLYEMVQESESIWAAVKEHFDSGPLVG